MAAHTRLADPVRSQSLLAFGVGDVPLLDRGLDACFRVGGFNGADDFASFAESLKLLTSMPLHS